MSQFLANPSLLVFWGSLLATLAASVMAEEQETRLRNGVFGAAAGSSVGALAGLFKNQPDLLMVGFLGSAIGGCVGWSLHFALAALAGFRPLRPLLEHQIGGIKSVRARLQQDEQEILLKALRDWRDSFTRGVVAEKQAVTAIQNGPDRNTAARLMIENWLASFVRIYGLVFDMIAGKQQYRSRATMIVYGTDNSGQIAGKHWIAYSGSLPRHKTAVPFSENSVGYKVLTEALPSPYFCTSDSAKGQGQSRDELQERPFYTFRVTRDAILALDWPSTLKEDDPYVALARDTFHNDVCPAIADLLGKWHGMLQGQVSLSGLP